MRKIVVALLALAAVLFLIKRKDMTWRQSLLKTIYPVLMLKSKLFPGKKDVQLNTARTSSPVSFYSLNATTIAGSPLAFDSLKGKKVLLVNTASDCGYTGQFDELERLQRQYAGKIVVLGFPANDFKQQEKGDNASIAEFCRMNYGVSFTMLGKSSVIKGAEQNPVFRWLSDPAANGWCGQAPVWNFCKYLVDENGTLLGYFSQQVSPLDKRLTDLIR